MLDELYRDELYRNALLPREITLDRYYARRRCLAL